MRDQRIAELVRGCWALEPRTLNQFAAILERHSTGEKVTEETLLSIQATRAAKHGPGADGSDMEIIGGVARIPIAGVIAKRSNQVNGTSQPRGTSGDVITNWIRQAVGNAGVHTILLAMDSPGGSVEALDEVAAEIRAARGSKKVVAHADGMMASAAYWLGSQAEALYATATSLVGSIGVYQLVPDSSGYYENAGVKMHIVRSGDNKGVGAPGISIDAGNLAALQAEIDHFFGMFVDDVVEGRGMARDRVLEVADGRVFVGSQAADHGLIDAVQTAESLLNDLTANAPGKKRRAQNSAAAAANTNEETHMEDQKDTPAAKADPKPAAAETVASLAEAYPDQVAQIRQDAAAGERQRVAAIQNLAMLPMQAELVESLVETGATESQAAVALMKDAKANRDKWTKDMGYSEPSASVTTDPHGGPDGDEVFDESRNAFVKPGDDAEGTKVDYSSCTSEDAVTAMAEAEWDTLPEAERNAFVKKGDFLALRRGEYRRRQAS